MAILDPLSLTASATASADEFGSLPAAVVAAGTLATLGALNLAAPRLGLIDRPDGGRKRHAQAVPLTGGFAILAGAGLGALASMSLGAAALEILALLPIVAVVHAFDERLGAGQSALWRMPLDNDHEIPMRPGA